MDELALRLAAAHARIDAAETSLSALGTPAALRALDSLAPAAGPSAARRPPPPSPPSSPPRGAIQSNILYSHAHALFFSSDEGTLRAVFASSLLGLLLLLLSGALERGGGDGGGGHGGASLPPVRLRHPVAPAVACTSICTGGALYNVTVRVPIVHPSQRVGYGFGDSNRTRPYASPDEWGISYNVGPGVPAASRLQVPCGVIAFSDVVAVRSDYFWGRVVVLARAPGSTPGLPAEVDLKDHNFDEVLALVEAAPPPRPGGCNGSAAALPPGGGRPVFFYVDTGPRAENFAHWEGESAIFMERWRCVKAHYPSAKVLLEHRNRFKTMVLAALFDLPEDDIATVANWELTNGGAGAGSAPPCERGNVVLLPPLQMLNQWTTDVPMQGALVSRYFGAYAEKFGQPAGCPAAPPRAGAPGALLMLPHGRINEPSSLEEYTPTIDHEFTEIHHRNTSYEAGVLAMVKELGGGDFYGAEANNARLQLEVLRRARVVVTSYGTSMFHNALLARGATFIVMVGRVPLHHVLMPTFAEWVRAAAKWNKFHFIMGPFDTARVRELVEEALAAPTLPCPLPPGDSVAWSGCMKKNKEGPYESSFDRCD
jgi:hypothetical protein